KLALSQHNPRWRVIDVASAADAMRMGVGGQSFGLLLLGAATSEHIDLGEIEALREAFPDAPIVVTAESDNPHRARLILGAGTRGFLPSSLSVKVLMGALDLVLAGGIYVPSSLIEANQARPAPISGARSTGEPWNDLTRRQR